MQCEQVACGDHHCIALTRWGEVYTWGAHSQGQLGQGSNPGSEAINGCLCSPKKVDALAGHFIRQVSVSSHHDLLHRTPQVLVKTPYHPCVCQLTQLQRRGKFWSNASLFNRSFAAVSCECYMASGRCFINPPRLCVSPETHLGRHHLTCVYSAQ